MLFQTLDKLKRQSLLAAILMMALGVIMLICPESYVNTLVVTVGYGMIIFAIVEMLEFIVSKKAPIHYITFTGALFIAILGVFILIYNQDLLRALGWLFGFVLVQDGLFSLLNALLFVRRSNRKGWWILIVLAVVLMTLGLLIFLNPWWDSPTMFTKIIGGALLFSAFVSALRLIWVWPFKNGKESVQDASDKRAQKLADKFENEKEQIKHSTEEMSAELKRLLESEIAAFLKREKHRSTEMVAIFARHNFYANGFTPQELRTTLEDLGPTYVKIGQIMSSRVDLLPAEYCRELAKLRDSVKPLDPAVVKAVIEQETGKKIDEIYTEFRDEPLGSASIAQVHYGVLKDGTRVVTKVQRPLIADMMRKDFRLLNKLADLVNVIEEDSDEQVIDFKSVIAEVERVTKAELDFRVEAENTRLFREKCLEDEELISCPTIINDLTTERIFTMTYIDGCTVANTEKLAAEGCDLDKIGRIIVDSYLHQVLDVGIFHADPHQGNILVSHGKPYWIDFGMIGQVTDKDIDLIQDMVKALLIQDADSLVNAVMSMGAASEKTDRAKLTRDAEMFIEKYMNVKSVSDINAIEVFDEVMSLAAKNHVSMPGRFTLLARSLTTMEGVVEQLCPDLNIFNILYDKLKARARQNMNIPRELFEKGNELIKAGKKAARIPLLASELLEGMVKGKTRVRVELSEYEEPLNRILHFLRYTVLTVVALVLFIGSCILCTTDFKPLLANGMPLLAVAGIVFSIALTIFSIKRLK